MKTRRIVFIIVGVALAFAIYGLIIRGVFGRIDNPGIFGDMFGGFNALFAALSAVGIVVAIFIQQEQLEMQRQELGLQREELRMQREEMAKSRAELAEQARVQNRTLLATVVQLKIEKLNCGNMADQMEAERNRPGARENWITKIRHREDEMNALINELEAAIQKKG